MADPSPHPSFPTLLQRFFVDHLRQQRAVSANTDRVLPRHIPAAARFRPDDDSQVAYRSCAR